MTVSWMGPARRLADAAAVWEGPWSLLVAARRASLLPGLDDELAFTEAALDLREAGESWSGCTVTCRCAARSKTDAPEKLALARVRQLTASAYRRVTGRPP